jgi:glycosyltransferase involved in cell wall biosynthesis
MRLIYTTMARIPSEKAHPYQIVQMCEAFAQAGVDVTLLYRKHRNPTGLHTQDIWNYYGVERNFHAEQLAGLNIYPLAERLPKALVRPYTALAEALLIPTFNLSLLGRLAGENEAVIYSRDPLSLYLIAVLWPQRAKRLFFEAHTFPFTGAGLWLRKKLARRIGGVIVITRHLRERYEAIGVPPDRLLAVHDGFRPARFAIEGDRAYWRSRLGWPVGDFIVGYAGRFESVGGDKGLDLLGEAVAALSREGPARLGLVGGPAERVQRLRERLARQGLPPDLILYAGQVPPADVPGYLRAFDVCAIASPYNEFFAYYTSPLKLFEYMASGSPLVATDLPSTAEIIHNGENGLLVPPGDPEAMAVALRWLRDEPELGERLAKQAQQDVQAYTWEARARRIVEMISAHTSTEERYPR